MGNFTLRKVSTQTLLSSFHLIRTRDRHDVWYRHDAVVQITVMVPHIIRFPIRGTANFVFRYGDYNKSAGFVHFRFQTP